MARREVKASERAAPNSVTDWRSERVLAVHHEVPINMAKPVPKITLSASRDIPFNKLVLSQSNVRRLQAGVSIEELAEDIARRSLLQALNVRPVLDADGAETGMLEFRRAAAATGRSSVWSSRSAFQRRR